GAAHASRAASPSRRRRAPASGRPRAATKGRPRAKAPARPRGRWTPPDPARVARVLAALAAAYPDARCELNFETPLQLLIATILSAQCTDARVNMVTPGLFARYPDAAAFAAADTSELEHMVRSTGFYRNKARAIRECCADIVSLHGGEVPRTLEALTALR